MRRQSLFIAGWLLIVSARAPTAFATEWYVDNQDGDTVFDGKAPQVASETTGPARTIAQVLRRAQTGDTIHLAKRDTPYYDSLQISGSRFVGHGSGPFTIDGHGAVISGARPVPAGSWKSLTSELWSFTPRKKGHYNLMLHDQPITETPWPAESSTLPQLERGSWCAWRGKIYFRAPSGYENPHDLPMAFASEDVGISLVDAVDVVIRDLTIEHFRIDGVNAHDRCRNVVLENVRLMGNGRAGLAAGGSSQVVLRACELSGNRVTQVLNTEVARTDLEETELTHPPGVGVRIKGGRVQIDGKEAASE